MEARPNFAAQKKMYYNALEVTFATFPLAPPFEPPGLPKEAHGDSRPRRYIFAVNLPDLTHTLRDTPVCIALKKEWGRTQESKGRAWT